MTTTAMPRTVLFRLIVPVLVLWAAFPILASATDNRALTALLDTVLASHVEDGYVDYPEISRNVRFHKYIEALAGASPDAFESDGERLAFWLNAYNALAINSVLSGVTPISTLDRIKFFRTTEHRIAGRELDLNSIEEIVVGFGDPRVRFALVNASYTAPILFNAAYTGAAIDEELDAAARRFINDNRRNRFSEALRTARLSKLFEWHYDEFGGTDAAVLEYVSRYVDNEEQAKSMANGQYKIKYMDYEWSINGRPM